MAAVVGTFSNSSSIAPLNDIISITPGTSFTPVIVRSIYISVSGDITINTPAGNSKTIPGLAAGIWHPIAAQAVASLTGGGVCLGGI